MNEASHLFLWQKKVIAWLELQKTILYDMPPVTEGNVS